MSLAALFVDLPFHGAESFLLELALFLIFVFALTKIVVAAYRELRRFLGKAHTSKIETPPRE
jgi:hypothetical protein